MFAKCLGTRSLSRLAVRRTLSQKSSNKVYPTCAAALEGLEDGMTVLFGGFGNCGIPENLIEAIVERGTKNLTAISNECGTGSFGLGLLVNDHQISVLHASYVGENKSLPDFLKKGQLELHLTPQGTLAEKLRAGGAGIPAFYTPTGVGTVVEHGYPVKYKSDGSGEVEKHSQPKEVREFNGRKYVLEESYFGDFACIKGWKADKAGNVVFRSTAQNFNPDCAKAAKIAIVEVEEIVETGELHPDEIHLPGIYVHRIVREEHIEKRIEKLKYKIPNAVDEPASGGEGELSIRDHIAKRAAQEISDGMYVNLGIGIPTVVSNYIPENIIVTLQSENGLLGMGSYPFPGDEDPDLVNAGKETITFVPGSVAFSSAESFAMIRGKHLDLTILGALEVSATGDLASWIVPGKTLKGMGGAMDLVAACERVIVATSHTDKYGNSKIVGECHLPLTGKGVVDMIITELAVFECDRKNGGGLTLLEITEGYTLDDITAKTAAPFKVSPNLKYTPK